MAQAPTYPNEVVIPSLPNRIKDDLNSGVIPGCFGAILGGLTLGGGGEAILQWLFSHSCFPAGTPVQTPEGSRAIETIKAGEQVWSYDLMASRWRPCRVLQTFRRDYEGHSTLVTVAGETIESTLRHPYWVRCSGEALAERPRREGLPSVPEGATTSGRWVDAGDLHVGDELLLRDGRIAAVEAVRSEPYHAEVYNIAVAELQCYAVGHSGVLVHNTSGAELTQEQWQEQVDALQDKIADTQQEIDEKLNQKVGFGKNQVDGSMQYLQELMNQLGELLSQEPN